MHNFWKVLWFSCNVYWFGGVADVSTHSRHSLQAEDYNPYTAALEAQPWASDQGYVEVRQGAFLFWWLYYAGGRRLGAQRMPLVVWIQGGPGLAATGVANFAELGPLDMKLRPRNHTWAKGRNVLLIDHPVGTGFSYATNNDPRLYSTTDRQVALDLFHAIKGFIKVHPEFKKGNTYIASQSYGGKIAPRLAYMIHRAVLSGHIHIRLRAVGIGSGWVDPKASSLELPRYLYHTGLIDKITYNKTSSFARKMAMQITNKEYANASMMDSHIFLTYQRSNYIHSFINIAKADVYKDLEKLGETINRYVKPTLRAVNQSRSWSYMSNEVFEQLTGNLMLPATRFVEKLLNETTMKVVVYNGNMDATCPMAGAVNWVHQLRWSGSEQFRSNPRIKLEGKMNGFYKSVERLSLWWVLGAGHWVPEDNPEAMEQILDYMTSDNQCQ